MTRELKSKRKGPAKADSAVIFLHGYGADGADLLGLADSMSSQLPATAFYAPDAADRCVTNPMGFQWFPIPWMDGSTTEQLRIGAMQSFNDINTFVDEVLAEEELAPERLALVGFSQGTMMALEVAPRRFRQLAGVVGFSGRFLDPDTLAPNVATRPPILLAHGDQDPVVPFANMTIAADTLAAAGFQVQTHAMKGTPHGISPDGVTVARQFLHGLLVAG